jgi:hypothetical protein
MRARPLHDVVTLACLLLILAPCSCSRLEIMPRQPAESPSFFLVIQNDEGRMLGFERINGSLRDLTRIAHRPDGSVIVTDITSRAARRVIESSMNQILVAHGYGPGRLARYLANGHVSCHRAGMHVPRRGGNFAGPALLECEDALLAGTSPLQPETAIWKQRGLLLNAAQYPDRIHFDPIGPAAPDEHPSGDAAGLSWEVAASYFRAIPKIEPAGKEGDPSTVMLELCPAGNGIFPELEKNTAMLSAALRALQRFAREQETNRKLIVAHTGERGFDVDRLGPEVRARLLELMRMELGQPE